MIGSRFSPQHAVTLIFSFSMLLSWNAQAIHRPSDRDPSLLQDPTKIFYDRSLVSKPQVEAKKRALPTPTPKPAFKHHYFNYFVEFAGPSADFALPLESYSPFGDDYVPLNLFQSIDYAYAFNNNNRLGFVVSTIWNFENEVIDKSGNIRSYSDKLTFFDPNIYYQFYNLFTNSYSWVNGRVSLDLPLSDFSRSVGYQTGIYNSYSWNFKLNNPSYYLALNFDGWLFFYDPNEGWNRFQFALGHEWGYNFNPNWTLHTSSVFDLALRAQGGGTYQYSENNVDRFRVTLRWNVDPGTFQVGAYVQSPIYYPTFDRTMLGLNMNIWF